MRRVYANQPSHERTVLRRIKELSKELSVPVPGIVFWSRGDAQYEIGEHTLYLPCIDWLDTHMPDGTDEGAYWLLALHEYAHYLQHLWIGGIGHDANMYAIATALALHEDLPLDAFYYDERTYKPLAFKRGRRLAGKALIAAYKVGPLNCKKYDGLDEPGSDKPSHAMGEH